jgi:hypothetical protein
MIAGNGWLSMRRFWIASDQSRGEIATGCLMDWNPVTVRYGAFVPRNFWNSKNHGRAKERVFYGRSGEHFLEVFA